MLLNQPMLQPPFQTQGRNIACALGARRNVVFGFMTLIQRSRYQAYLRRPFRDCQHALIRAMRNERNAMKQGTHYT
ncbi:hypothetical protein KMS_R25870 [Pseudomonas sp. LRP2-20]|uniref:hypothetical protein n=1 Tax=Pseudomonas sp. LRP2-20 TaxID=2944234 RepID=UPI0021868B5C|nr:hypothetical protein [Pseudomonas sp. LRP2-20]BDM22830.1 hypothetical protein KMS_R25870 [Pseudomonas sp. LRP2-20]